MADTEFEDGVVGGVVVRTTSVAIASIIEVDSSIDLTPFIETANLVVTDVCGDFDYTDEKLEMIERWLAAHFYAVRDPRPASEAAGSVSANYQYKVDLNLAVTTYGQQAMLLDTSGGLAALNKRASSGHGVVTGVRWMGKDDWGRTDLL
jgi:hypothetical protein